MTFPATLQQLDLCWLRFELEFDTPCRLPRTFPLQLRRELLQTARELLDPQLCRRLFEPALPDDPAAVKRYQKPSPGFVLKPSPVVSGEFATGDEYVLDVLFVGAGIQLVGAFVDLIRALSVRGLHSGHGRGELLRIAARSADGDFTPIWQRGGRGTLSALPLLSAAWLLDDGSLSTGCRVEFLTPARLVTHGRPLYHPDFCQLFPFFMRRVGAMLYHWGGIDALPDVAEARAAAASLEYAAEDLVWCDWRQLGTGGEGVGGLVGAFILRGAGLADVGWILQLAELFHLGRSAAYGHGALQLQSLA